MRGLLPAMFVVFLLAFGGTRVWSAGDPPSAPAETPQTAPGESLSPADSSKNPAGPPAESREHSEKPPGNAGEGPSETPKETPPSAEAPDAPAPKPVEPSSPAEIRFSISEYQVEGNTVLPQEKLKEIFLAYLGPAKQLQDVEQARASLERAYHDAGYPTVLVIVPEQTIEHGVVRLTVVESKLGEIRVNGNRYFSKKEILERLPSLKEGSLIYEPVFLKELNEVNGNPDLQVAPVLALGQKPGTVDLDVNVKDRIPIHGTLEWNTAGTPGTPRQRLNGSIQYADLFSRDQIVTFQTTQTPTLWGDVQVYGLSYAIPFKKSGQLLALYGAYSNSETGLPVSTIIIPTGGGIGIVGNATILGTRYMLPLGSEKSLNQQLSLGLDYKRLNKSNGTFPDETALLVSGRLNYTPLSVAYTALRPDNGGVFKFSGTIRGYIAGMIPGGEEKNFRGDPANIENSPGNRAGSTGTFMVIQGELDRTQDLPEGFVLSLKVDGQWGSEPLIPAEQYFAGGVDTVRGYVESEELGDNAFHGTVELTAPPLRSALPAPVPVAFKEGLRFSTFYDAAYLWINRPPAGQIDHHRLQGTGLGIHLKLSDNVQARFDLAYALQNAVVTFQGDFFAHVSLKVSF